MPARPQDLLPHLDAFLGFARKRTGDPELAAEAVQEALARALARIGDVRDDDRVLPWFWRILRNTIADLAGRRRRAAPLAAEPEAAPTAERAAVCACLGPVLAGLPERQRRAVERVDLAGEEPAAVATALGVSAGNLKVLRHRARVGLRAGLEAVCRACARHGCVDCDCGAAAARKPRSSG